MNLFDPLEKTREIEKLVVQNSKRRYYRLARVDKWYGGIVTSDCLGCNLKCVFCWSGQRDYPESGRFYSPKEIFQVLTTYAGKFGYHQLRISGNEPTIAKEHLLKLLELFDETNYTFILETNGILIGYDKSFAKDLARFKCLQVRVSIKGTNEEEFSMLTGAKPEAFNLQLKALENLLDYNVRCSPAVMLSFSPEENFKRLSKRIKKFGRFEEIEKEYVILYPITVERLRKVY